MLHFCPRRLLFCCFLLFFFYVKPAHSAFSFSGAEAEDAREDAGTRLEITRLMSASCNEALLRKRTAILIGETTAERGWQNRQGNYGPHFDEINRRLHEAGIKTFSHEEIHRQIAQEEIEAVLSNDPDRAIAAAKGIGAAFLLKGTISTKTRLNPLVRVTEVSVTMVFSLVNAAGRTIASVQETGDSYAGADTLSASLMLVREKAEMVVARLYNAYCVEITKEKAAVSPGRTPVDDATPVRDTMSAPQLRQDPLVPAMSGATIKDF